MNTLIEKKKQKQKQQLYSSSMTKVDFWLILLSILNIIIHMLIAY